MSQCQISDAPIFPKGAGMNDAENARTERRIAELDAQLLVSETENQRFRSLLDQERRCLHRMSHVSVSTSMPMSVST